MSPMCDMGRCAVMRKSYMTHLDVDNAFNSRH